MTTKENAGDYAKWREKIDVCDFFSVNNRLQHTYRERAYNTVF